MREGDRMRRNVHLPRRLDPAVLARLLSQIVVVHDSGCWLVRGRKDKYFYIHPTPGGPKEAAHRYVYEAFVGPIPRGFVVDHLCENRGCQNPLHLEPVTMQLNIQRGRAGARQAEKTNCLRGHPLSGQNLYLIRSGDRVIARRCRACNALAARRYYESRGRLAQARRGKSLIGGIDKYEPRMERPQAGEGS